MNRNAPIELVPCRCGKPAQWITQRLDEDNRPPAAGFSVRCKDKACWRGPRRKTKHKAAAEWNSAMKPKEDATR